ncbi:tryptophan synthase, alpha chain [Archaeoglobus sulfaticallidus PM70-1]|uniref:Tryptophan synthase alpha chain n=1 Tax=Archaeoglobus sulfaticallidus PM70-1 TaxID=387631 RepID=N0BAM8_9EURY|nr:tryptophan synthase subunit alpha [Archaeoglobus sulfaticallidus]AGK60669.1 tryptophan synthase, alpha chain [Archaeoglobus sulfaticallidus PM70-1]
MKLNKSIITFITAGDPSKKATINFLFAMEKYADILELGIPFSDPVADGEVIQRANYRALKHMRLQDVFYIVEEFREHSDKPLILMTYYNPVFRMGLEKFVSRAKEAGVDGLIVVDLPVDEADDLIKVSRKYGIGNVFLSAPNTSESRLKAIDEVSEFIYLVSTYGVTGERDKISKLAFESLSRIKRICNSPVAVGFGVSKEDHVRELFDAGADGVVMGSAIVRLIERYGEDAEDLIAKKLKAISAVKEKTK